MRIYHEYDKDGFYVGDTITKKPNTTEIRPPQPCWKPQFRNGMWIETATDEEKRGDM